MGELTPYIIVSKLILSPGLRLLPDTPFPALSDLIHIPCPLASAASGCGTARRDIGDGWAMG